MGIKVKIVFWITDEQLKFQLAFKDHFGRPNKVNFLKHARLSAFKFYVERTSKGLDRNRRVIPLQSSG